MVRSLQIEVAVFLISAFAFADALSLPSFHVHAPVGKSRTSVGWWTQVGDRVYHAPTNHAILSPHMQDYYYAVGSYDALPAELRTRRVGGEGRWHIFHFPDGGASLLQTRVGSGGRRASVSRLHKLTSGLTLAATFPEYVQRGTYEHPLSLAGQAIEARAVGDVTTDVYTEYLAKLTSLPSRSWESQAMSDRAEKLLKDEFDSMGHQTCLHTFHSRSPSANEKTLVNVMAFVPGKTSGIVVVGAHYDSRPYAGSAPGAVDNGSGVAALLAMARAFKRTGVSPQKSVYFVGFAGEEAGLLGSAAFAEQLVSGGRDIPQDCRPEGETFLGVRADKDHSIRALIMDEIGWVSPNLEKATVNLESFDSSFDMMDHMLNACRVHNGENLTVVHNRAPFGSDHMSFLERGFQSVLSINGDDEGYPFYHSSRDTFNQVTPDYATGIAKMNMGALLRMTGVEDTSLSSMSPKIKRVLPDKVRAKRSMVLRF